MPQSVQVYAALALTRTLAGSPELAREASTRASEIAQRVHDPAGAAAALEAAGTVGELPDALEALRSARAGWERLGRPLDVARCDMLLGRRLRDQDSEAAKEILVRAAAVYDELGVRHLAEQARELVSV